MRLLERVLIDVIGRYVPDVDLQKLKVDLLHQRANLSSVNLAPEGHVAPTVFLAGLPFTLLAPSTLKSLDIWFDTGRLRANGSGLRLRLVHIPYNRCAGNGAVNDAWKRAKRASLAEAERQATGIFGKLLNNLLPVLMQKVQFVMTDVRVSVEFGGKHFFEVSIDRLQTTSVDYAPLTKYDSGGVHTGERGHRSKASASSNPTATSSAADDLVVTAGDLAKDVVLEGVALTLGRQSILSLVCCTLKLRYRLGEYDVELSVDDALKFLMTKVLSEALLALRRENRMWDVAAKYMRPRQSALEQPLDWWHFAVRMLMRSTGCGHWSADFGRSKLTRCVAYYHAHLERLSKGNRAKSAVVEKCLELEDVLDVDTIIFVRSRARKNVRAQTANRFAAEDWLGWMLIGHDESKGNGDREMTKDIRDAVDSLEAAESQGMDSVDDLFLGMGYSEDDSVPLPKNSAAVPNDATSWTTATAVLLVKSIVFSFVDEDDGSNLDVIIDNSRLQFEVDSGFSTLTFGASVDALAVSDGRVNYIRQVGVEQGRKGIISSSSREEHISSVSGKSALGISANTESKLLSSSEENGKRQSPILIVELQAFPKSPEAEASLNIFVGSVAVHVDIASLSPIFVTLSRFQSAQSGIEDNARYPDILPLLSTREGLESEEEASANSSGHVGSGPPVPSSANRSARPSRDSLDRSAEYTSKLSSDWFENLVLSFRLERFQVYLSSGLAVRDKDCLTRDSFGVDVSRVLCAWSPFKNDPGGGFRAACTVECRSCVMANDLAFSSGENSVDEDDAKEAHMDVSSSLDEDGFIRVLHRNKPCLLVDRLTLSVASDSVLEVRCGDDGYLHLREMELESSVFLMRKVFEELESELQVEESRGHRHVSTTLTGLQRIFAPPFTPSAWNRFTLQRKRVHLAAKDSAVVRVLGNAFFVSLSLENESTHPLLTITARQLCVENGSMSPGSLTVSIRSVTAADAHGKTDFAIAPADAKSQLGLSIVSQTGMTPSDIGVASKPRTEIELGQVELESTAYRVRSLSSAMSRLLLIFRDKPLSVESQKLSVDSDVIAVQAPPLANDSSCESKYSHNVVASSEFGDADSCAEDSFDLSCRSVRMKIHNEDFVMTVSGTGLAVKSGSDRWDGHFESIDITEYSTCDRSETQFVSSRTEALIKKPSFPHVRVSFDGKDVQIFLTSMKLVVFKPSLERTIRSLSDLFSDVTVEWSRFMESDDGNSGRTVSNQALAPDSETGIHCWRVSGKRVFVVLPQSKDGVFAVGLELGEVTIASTAARLQVSGRKVAILSSSRSSKTAKRNPSVVWDPIVAALDIDIIRSASSEMLIEGLLNRDQHHREKNEWKIELPKTPTVLLTVERARLVSTVVTENLFVSGESNTASGAESEAVDEISGGLEVSAQAGSRYDRTVVSFVAPGLAVELFESVQIGDGMTRKALALIEIGPIRLFFDSVSEKPIASSFCTEVTVFTFDVGCLRVHDRQVDVHDSFRLVLCIEGAADRGGTSDLQQFVPSARLTLHEKRTGEESVEAKVSARVTHPRILLQPVLFASIATFFFSCGGSADESSVSDVDDLDVDDGDGNQTCRKTSVVVVSPQVFIAETPLSGSSRGLELCAEELKVSLRQNLRGMFTRGTQIRVRGLELSVSPPDVLSHYSSHTSPVVMHTVDPGSPDAKGNSSRQSLASAKEPTISALKCWSLDSDAPVVLLRIVSMQFRPPTVESSAFYVTVPTIVFDATIRDFASLFSLLGRLHLPQTDRGASTTRSNDSKTSPLIDVRILDIECIFRIPQHRLQRANVRYGGDGSSVVRAKLGLDVFMRGASLDSTLRVFAVRSYDGQSGIWDRRDVLEACQVALTYCWTGVSNVVVKSSRVRLNFSPLIVKSLSNLVHSMEAALSEDVNSRRDATRAPGTDGTDHGQSPLKLDVGVQAIEVYLLSDQLRVRATVSDIRTQLSLLSDTDQVRSEFKLYVGNFTVRNEILGTRGNGVRDWSFLLAKTVDVPSVGSRGTSRSVVEPLLLLCESSFSSMPRSRLRTGRRTEVADVLTGNGEVTSTSNSFTQPVEDENKPLLKVVLHFGGSSDEEVVGAVLMAGLDLCVDVDVVSELVAWGEMAMDSITTARHLHRSGPVRPQVKSETNTELGSTLEVSQVCRQVSRHGRIVIGSSGLRISARAPSSAQSSARTLSVQKVAEFVFGSESVSDLTVALPMRSISFDVASSDDIAKAVISEYQALVFSRSTLGQILRQSPSVISLVRVGMLAYLRRADAPQRLGGHTASRRAEGLLEAADAGNAEWNRKHCIRERVSTLDLSSGSRVGGDKQRRAEVIGMEGDADVDVVADGASLFQLLIKTDSRLRVLGDKYSFFALLDGNKSLMVTDKHILIVTHGGASVPVVERRLAISSIERYSVSLRNPTILLVHFLTGGLGARQLSSNMLSQFEARARAVMPLELKCGDGRKAESLSRWLPSARKQRRNLDLPCVDLDLPFAEQPP